jgi:16S rRNA (cytosine967-C5)-methyltransferase
MQARLIERAVALARPGATIVCATCSLEPEEGEAHLAATLERLPVDLAPVTRAELPGLADAVTPEGTLRTLPFHLAMDSPRLSGLDGFFVMRLKRR